MKSLYVLTFLLCLPCQATEVDCRAVPKILNHQIEALALSTQCNLFPEQAGFNNGINSLSHYWAQEFSGVDLVRATLEEDRDSWSLPPQFLDVLDTVDNGSTHGYLVRNLIMGPHPSAVIPASLKQQPEVIEMNSSYPTYVSKLDAPPQYINNSMGWGDEVFAEAFRTLLSRNTVVITAAGNEAGLEVEQAKRILATNSGLIIVGSTDYIGAPSHFSRFAPEVTISVPSNFEILSYDQHGRPKIFGGTSGATPLVTGTLAAFVAVTGLNLVPQEASLLLRRTALRSSTSYALPPQHGAGTLNAFKILKLAFKLKKKCIEAAENIQTCGRRFIESNDFYTFPEADLSASKAVFASCFSGVTQVLAGCEEKRMHLRKLREEAFLNPYRKDIWEGIACINSNAGYETNAEYFHRISQVQTEEDFSRINPTSFFLNDENIVRYALASPHFANDSSLMERVLQNKLADDYLALYVLSQKSWTKKPEVLLNLIRSGRADYVIELNVLNQPHWQSYFSENFGLTNPTVQSIREKLEHR